MMSTLVVIFIVLLIVIGGSIAYIDIKKKKERERVKQLLREQGTTVRIIRAQEIIDAPLSRVVDRPEGLNILAAIFGVLFMFLYYVWIIGFPPYTALAGLLFALAPSYIQQLYRRILDIRATTQTLHFINSLSALLRAPNATLNSAMYNLNNLEVEPWIKIAFESVVKHGSVMFPALPRVTGLWSIIGTSLSEDSAAVSEGLAGLLEIQVKSQTRLVNDVVALTSLAENLSGFMMPATIGLGIIITGMSLLRGLPPMQGIPQL